MFSALLYGFGGRMLTEDETKVAFDGPEGLAPVRLLDRHGQGRQDANFGASATATADLQAFGAGKMGMMFRTTAQVRQISGMVGNNFEMADHHPAVIDPVKGRLPTGGAGAMMTAQGPGPSGAAWEFIKFATSAEGTTLMVKNTGYVPCNQLAIDDASYLGEFYKANPLFVAATKQVHLMVPWYAFPARTRCASPRSWSTTSPASPSRRPSPEEVVRDMAREVTRLIPRRQG